MWLGHWARHQSWICEVQNWLHHWNDGMVSCPVLQIASFNCHFNHGIWVMALCAAIPMMAVSTSINKGLGLIKDWFLTFKATVHEDNLGALTLATLELGRHTPRSKFYTLRMHWFQSWMEPKEIEIIHCPSKEQKADSWQNHLFHRAGIRLKSVNSK